MATSVPRCVSASITSRDNRAKPPDATARLTLWVLALSSDGVSTTPAFVERRRGDRARAGAGFAGVVRLGLEGRGGERAALGPPMGCGHDGDDLVLAQDERLEAVEGVEALDEPDLRAPLAPP